MSSLLRKLEGLLEEKEQEWEETMSSRVPRSSAAPYQWSRTVERKLAELESVKRELKETRQQQRHLQSLDYDMEFDYQNENRLVDESLPVAGHKRPRGGTRRSAYATFCAEARPVVKVWNPRLRDKQVAARLSEMWKAMSEEERAPFEEQNVPSKQHRVDDELKQKVLNFLERKDSNVKSAEVGSGDENAPPEEKRECEEAVLAPEGAVEAIASRSTDEEELRAAIAMSLHSNTSAEAIALSVTLNTPSFVTVRSRDEQKHNYSLKPPLDLDDIFN